MLQQTPRRELAGAPIPHGKVGADARECRSDAATQEALSPSSSSSASTRPPDSDSEEFLLPDKEDVATASEEEAEGCGTEPSYGVAQAPPRRPLRARGLSDPLRTDLAWFRRCAEVTFAPWADGDFATVGRLAKSVHGEVFYLTARDGTGVVAKIVPTDNILGSRSKATDERLAWFGEGEVTSVEDSWNEIAVLTFLQRSTEQCKFLLKLLGVFQDQVSTYVITEYCEGGELFERVAYGDVLSAEEARRYASQLLLAVRHLHGHNVGHRDISLENVLLRNGDCVLMDFGQAVRLRTMDGVELRYFAEAGKRMYRAPEMYVPREEAVQVVCPPEASPGRLAQVSYDRCRFEALLPADAVPGQPCRAEPYGYAAAPVDLFACGVCAFVLAVGKPPWAVARDTDPTFSFIRRHGVPALLRQWRACAEPASAHVEDDLLGEMLRVCPEKRLSIDECLRSAWIAGGGDACGEAGAPAS